MISSRIGGVCILWWHACIENHIHMCMWVHSKDLEDLNTRLAHVQRLHQGDPERMKKAQMDSKSRSFALSLFLSFSLSLSLSLSLFLSLSFLLFLSFSLSYSISFSLLHTRTHFFCAFFPCVCVCYLCLVAQAFFPSLRVCLQFVFGCARPFYAHTQTHTSSECLALILN